ncbi:MAG: hypothetical protein Q7J07_05635 [Pelolinea sp.]|nr:hypothetical protein [Pelolinea sp.]
MKHKYLVIITALIILSSVFVSCTRSASGGPVDTVGGDSELPNPVSTQSQLMKDIISGTQTAMAVPLDATAEAENAEETETTDAGTVVSTPEPEAVEEEIALPTSTAGPPPEIELNYNTTKCGPGYWLCTVSYQKDQTVTVQATYPWLLNDMDLRFKMGPEGLYDYSQYIVVGTAKYTPDSSKGYGFQVTLNIPDSLRGTDSIVVRLETNDTNYFGSDFFAND